MKKLLLITLMLALGLTGFSQTKTWNGTGTLWHTASHWDPPGVPGQGDNVIIPVGKVDGSNGPLINSNTNAVCHDLQIDGIGALDILGTLTYSGNVNVEGELNLFDDDAIMKYEPLTSIVVTSSADSGPNTLRRAIEYIDDGGVITFNLPTGSEEIGITSAPFTIDKSLTIDGTNALGSEVLVSVDGANTHRIFHITTAASGKTIEFKNMKIQHGKVTLTDEIGGGGIRIETGATLNVDNVIFYGNENLITTKNYNGGGAIYVWQATCNITNSTFDSNNSSKNAGAMYVYTGTCNITNSTFVGNTATKNGGAIYSNDSSNVTITGCTFNKNKAVAESGGGILNANILSITNSTFFENTAGGKGGAIYEGGHTNMKFTTISANTATDGGGGVFLSILSELTIQNCMLGNNTANSGGADFQKTVLGPPFESVVIDDGHNIVEESEGFTWAATGDITGQQDDLFGTGHDSQALADNGGPTQTLKIKDGSVARGAGITDAAVPTEQRGVSRLDPPTIGAFEGQTTYNPTTGKIWIDRNLGASQVATSSTDADAYGDLYQWGRLTDGHESRTSGTTPTQSTGDDPGHSNFITRTQNEPPHDWRSPQNDNLWQGVSGINNPCPSGFRLPTEAEWEAEMNTWSPKNATGAFNSLGLTLTGYRPYTATGLFFVGQRGFYWSSTVNDTKVSTQSIQVNTAGIGTSVRATGMSVRCIKD